jgi:hypothetical protein
MTKFTVVGYPTPGKAKAKMLLDAFCSGVPGASVARNTPASLPPGVAPAFYGVVPETVHLWEQAKREGRDWYYIDNAYFDPCRERYFRITKNRLQHSGEMDETDGKRWASLNLDLAPWREPGEHVVVCPASDQFMRLAAGYVGHWPTDIVAQLKLNTKRPLRFRPWDANKGRAFKSLPADLDGAHCLVTYTSAAAITALRYGVPVLVTAEDCISRPMAQTNVEKIEQLHYPEYRERWAMVVADNQWTVEEMAQGLPWAHMQAPLALIEERRKMVKREVA